jgi:outer membrane receptor protein involved in Fe transport
MEGKLNELEIFAEDIWALNDSTSLLFGVRYDHVNYGSFIEPESGNNIVITPKDLSATSFRLALTNQINDKQTFKVSYREGFRYPDVAYYLYLGLSNDGLENAGLEKLPDLQEETIKSFEINYLHELSNLSMNWEFNIYYNIHEGTFDWKDYTEEELGTARYNVAKNSIGFGPGSFANASDTFVAYGFEILNRWQPNQTTSVRASYAYSRPSGFNRDASNNLNFVNESGDHWASYPEHLFKLSYDQGFMKKFAFNLTTYYASNVNICLENCSVPTAAAKFHSKDRIRVNSKLQYHLTDITTIALTVQNLFKNDGPAVGYESRSGTGVKKLAWAMMPEDFT